MQKVDGLVVVAKWPHKNAVQQLVNLFILQDSADEAKKKSEEMLTAFEELQKLLKESNEGIM